GIDTTWSRIPNSEPVAAEIRQIISKFNPADPVASVPDLLKLRQAMSRIQDDSWISEKTAELDKIIAACLGLHVEVETPNATDRNCDTLWTRSIGRLSRWQAKCDER